MAAAQGFPAVSGSPGTARDATHFRELEMTLPEVAARIRAMLEERRAALLSVVS
jgi:hypothetical protein